ncbi:MAG: PA14 domain-containing protein [Cytophagaceae bacterium]
MKKIYLFLKLYLLFTSGFAATFYVKPGGNDNLDGLSIANAWKTLDAVNNRNFNPGDIIMLEGGSTFSGGLYFDQGDKTTAANPITITSYGSGKAVINSGNGFGLYVFNIGGIKVYNLKFTGSGPAVNGENGIKFFSNLANVKPELLIVEDVEVSGYSKSGILIAGKGYDSGFKNIRITGCRIHSNGEAGIRSMGDSINLNKVYAHHYLYIAHNKIYNITGQSDLIWFHTGSGIALCSVNEAMVEYNEAYNNGHLNNSPDGGPVGIWVYNSNKAIIQFNEAHHNKAGFDRDGGGFDIDGGTTNSIIQYNYSHDNEGAGLMVAQFKNGLPLKNNHIRYNISQNDGRKNDYPGILLWSASTGGLEDLYIYNNIIYLSTAPSGNPRAVYIDGPMEDVYFRNNIFYTTGYLYAVVSTVNNGIYFQNNSYYNSSGNFGIWWQGSTYNSLDAWRNAKNQEKIQGDPVGIYGNPLLVSAGGGGTISDMSKLSSDLEAYKLSSSSPLKDAGVSLQDLGVNMGMRDYYGYSIRQGTSYDIGVHEYPLPGTENDITVFITSPSDGSVFSVGSDFVLTAHASAGSSSITKVEFYNNGNLLSTKSAWPFAVNMENLSAGNYVFTAKAFSSSGSEVSSAVNVTVTPSPSLRNPDNPSNAVNGLEYSYYEGSWSNIPDFNSMSAANTGVVPTFIISERERDDHFGFMFSGYVDVALDGIYTFYTSSDEGSKLYIGTTLVVNNDGLHTVTEKSGTIGLKAGKHAIKVHYFEATGNETLVVKYSGPGITKTEIPSYALYRVGAPMLCSSTGSLTREVWMGITGDDMRSLITHSSFPDNPAVRTEVNSFEGPVNAGDNYGAKYSGFICPPVSGAYTFWISSDNHSELYLSTNDDPQNKRKIAFIEEGYTLPGEWLKYGSQKSLPQNLTAGVKYYIEALHKEGSGNDHFAAGWQLPGGNMERPIPGSRLSPYSGVITRNQPVSDAGIFKIYPNPAAAVVYVEHNSMVPEDLRLTIMDLTGREIFVKSFINQAAGVMEISIADLHPGIYQLGLFGDKKSEVHKLIVVH